jgi:plastocyanin
LRNRPLAVTAACLVLAFAAACGGGGGGTPAQSTPPPTGGDRPTSTPSGISAAEECTKGPIEGAQEAHMTDPHDWAPNEFTVPVGGSITWFNDSTLGHTVSFSSGPGCGFVIVNGSVSVTFNTPGPFRFICEIYPRYMSGTVTVQ